MNEQLNATLMSWVQFLMNLYGIFWLFSCWYCRYFYTVLTGAVQIRMFLQSIRVMKSSRTEGEDEHGTYTFQSICNRSCEPCWGG